MTDIGRFAGIDINKLQLQVHGHALDVLDYIAADLLLVDKVRAVGIVGRQDAARVGAKELGDGRVLGVLEAALVVALGHILAQ